MKRKFAILCMVLAVFTVLGSFSGCRRGKKTPTDQTSDEGTTARQYLDDLGPFDFGHREFRVMSVEQTNDGTYTRFDFEDMSGSKVDQAIFRRNREIEARFNIVFVDEYDTYPNCVDLLRNQVSADLHDYDLIMLINRDAFAAVLNGEILPVSKLQYLDQSKDYYLHDINETLTLNGRQFLCYTEESLYTFQRATCMIYNKNMAKDLRLNNEEDFYDLVRGDEWTFDKMFELMKDATRIDSEGNVNVYGLYGHGDYLFSTFFSAAGQYYITKTADSMKFTAPSNQIMSDITDTVLSFMDSKDIGFDYQWNAKADEYNTVFINRGSLFFSTIVGKVLLLKGIEEFDYGALPWPKYNSEQDRYYSRVVDAWLHVVPSNAEDPARTSVIIEALASGSAKHVFKAFYEDQTLLHSLRDEDSAEMLELVRSTRVLDWGGTVFAATIRSVIDNDVFVKRSVGLTTALKEMRGQVNSKIEEAEEGARKLAAS